MSEECQELKNIKYQTMLLNSNSKIVSTKKNSKNLDDFLQKEKAQKIKTIANKTGLKSETNNIGNFCNSFYFNKR